jgi:hypothetical protein
MHKYTLRVQAILGAFSNLRKATTNFVMSVRSCLRPHGTTDLYQFPSRVIPQPRNAFWGILWEKSLFSLPLR